MYCAVYFSRKYKIMFLIIGDLQYYVIALGNKVTCIHIIIIIMTEYLGGTSGISSCETIFSM